MQIIACLTKWITIHLFTSHHTVIGSAPWPHWYRVQTVKHKAAAAEVDRVRRDRLATA